MPELPEVETVRRGLEPLIVGQTIIKAQVRTPKLRTLITQGFACTVKGQRVVGLERRAKYILIHLDHRDTMIVHLGMTGSFHTLAKDRLPAAHDHVVFNFENGLILAFRDPRRFGQMELVRTDLVFTHTGLARLGPEPLDEAFTPAVLMAQIAGKRVAIKQALLDQRVVAGIGNIYASEALFYAGVHPDQPAGTLTKPQATRLVKTIRTVLEKSIAAGGSTLRDYRQVSGELGFFQDRFAVYDRTGQACPACTCNMAKTGGITRQVQGGRSTFFCPVKQKI